VNDFLIRLISGLLIGVSVAFIAFRLQALSRSGFIAAAFLGTVVVGLGGISWGIVLLAFFVPSSALSVLLKGKKTQKTDFVKGSRRDAWQVLANGGVAGLCVIVAYILEIFQLRQDFISFLWLMYAGSLAAASADTWGTEWGVISRAKPRMITNLKKVEPGKSGAVSMQGLAAASVGSLFVASATVIVDYYSKAYGYLLMPKIFNYLISIGIAGLVGALLDSLLGATLQAMYVCTSCHKETEKYPIHSCGGSTQLLRGVSWFSNDWVNAICTLTGAIVGLIFAVF
jgi:uncharacterized protein (TIGR00297 family)